MNKQDSQEEVEFYVYRTNKNADFSCPYCQQGYGDVSSNPNEKQTLEFTCLNCMHRFTVERRVRIQRGYFVSKVLSLIAIMVLSLLFSFPVRAQNPNFSPQVNVSSRFLGSSRIKNRKPAILEISSFAWSPTGGSTISWWIQSDGIINPNPTLIRFYRKPGEYIETLYVIDNRDSLRIVEVYVTVSRNGHGTVIIPE